MGAEIEIPSQVLGMVDNVLGVSAHSLEVHGSVPSNFVVMTPSNSLVVPFDLPNLICRDDAIQVVRGLVIDRGAIAVIQIAESWTVKVGKHDEERIKKIKSEGVAAQSDRIEIILVSVQCRSHGPAAWIAQVPIARDADGRPSVSRNSQIEFEFIPRPKGGATGLIDKWF